MAQFVEETRYEEAKNYCATFRPQARVVHNKKRATKQPLPPNLPCSNASLPEKNGNSDTEETVGDFDAGHASAIENIEIKPALEPLRMYETDVSAMNQLINDETIDLLITEAEIENPNNEQNADTSTSNNVAEEVVSIDNNANFDEIDGETEENDNDRNESITETVGDMEITYSVGHKFSVKTINLPMTVKKNDSLSGFMPYQGILDRSDVRFFSHEKSFFVIKTVAI